MLLAPGTENPEQYCRLCLIMAEFIINPLNLIKNKKLLDDVSEMIIILEECARFNPSEYPRNFKDDVDFFGSKENILAFYDALHMHGIYYSGHRQHPYASDSKRDRLTGNLNRWPSIV